MSSRRPTKQTKAVVRRVPQQARSRERVTEILKASADLIGEKGIDAVTMKEIGSRSGGPIASVYQYFPDKQAILASLYERYVFETRFILQGTIDNIHTVSDAMRAPGLLIDAYYEIMCQDSSAIDIMNAIKASKLLGHEDIDETRRQVQDFFDATSRFVEMERREDYRSLLFLLFNMADATIRLALLHSRNEAAGVIDQFRSFATSQAAYYFQGKNPACGPEVASPRSIRAH